MLLVEEIHQQNHTVLGESTTMVTSTEKKVCMERDKIKSKPALFLLFAPLTKESGANSIQEISSFNW